MGRAEEAVLVSPRAGVLERPWRVGPGTSLLLVALAYYIGCQAGFALRFPLSGISFFWPPNAVLTAALLLSRPTTWPALLLSAFVAHGVAHAMNGVPAGAWMVQFAGNAVQAVLASSIANRRSQADTLFSDVRSAVLFLVASIAAPAVASLIPAAIYVQLGWASNFGSAWVARTISNVCASLTLIPPLFVAARFLFQPPRTWPVGWVEFTVTSLAVTGLHIATALLAPPTVLGMSLTLYAPLPYLLWAVVRFRSAGLSFALLWTTVVTIGIAWRADGPFVERGATDTVLGVQIFLSATAVLKIFIAGLLEQRRSEHTRLVDAGRQNEEIMRRLHQTQTRYELATSAGGVGVWEWNMTTGHLLVEGGLKELLGYRNDEVRDHLSAWLGLVAAEDGPKVQGLVDAFVTGAITSFEADIMMSHRDGSQRCIASRGARSNRTDGHTIQVTGTYTDVTARREAERALRDASEAAARTWRISAMTELSASIAHELSQPLTAIVSNASAGLKKVETGRFPPDLHATLQEVLQDGRRASHIVERARDMFANRASQPAPLNLNEIARDVLEIARPRLRELQIAVEVNLDATLPAVIADPVQIRQVILNLVVNAADAMRDAPAPRTLVITSRRSRTSVTVSVRDSGPGILEESRPRIFEPFYTTKPDGLGMGLSISRSIMRAHHGTICALTNADRGATFRIKMRTAAD